MRPLARTFAVCAVLAAVTVTTASCDTSPYAAVANSHTIKQTALNAELAAWAGNKQYVDAVARSSGSSGATVAGFAPGTYNSTWVATILGNAIVSSLVHQHLAALHQKPDQNAIESARAVSEISQIGWTNFSPAFRDTLTTRLAELGTVTPPAIDAATLKQLYDAYSQYFVSQVCALQAAAFSLEQAQRLSDSGYPGGTKVCYSQTDIENQPADIASALRQVPLFKSSQPIKTRFGYEVIEIVSRDAIGFTPELQRILSVAYANSQGAPNPAVEELVLSAKVKVNPEYGTWNQGQVSPPRTPGSSQ